jgi:Zn-dependent alcohol dehydrogenase
VDALFTLTIGIGAGSLGMGGTTGSKVCSETGASMETRKAAITVEGSIALSRIRAAPYPRRGRPVRLGLKPRAEGTSSRPGAFHCCATSIEAEMLDQLRILAQPGAVVATVLVLLLMAAGDAAIVIAAKGWPFE